MLIATPSQLPNGGIRSSPRTSSRLHFKSLLGPATPAGENRPCWLSPSAQVSQQSSPSRPMPLPPTHPAVRESSHISSDHTFKS